MTTIFNQFMYVGFSPFVFNGVFEAYCYAISTVIAVVKYTVISSHMYFTLNTVHPQ